MSKTIVVPSYRNMKKIECRFLHISKMDIGVLAFNEI